MKFSSSFDRTEMHRPMLLHSFLPGCSYLSLQWGNKWSDPVWRLEVEFDLPVWVHRWLDRRHKRRWDREHGPTTSGPRPVP